MGNGNKKGGSRKTFAAMTTELNRRSGIPIAEAPARGKDLVVFSFKYLDGTNAKFGLGCCQDKSAWTDLLIERLKNICSMTLNEFLHPVGNPKSWRSHQVDFSKTSHKNGFPIASEVWQDRPWQFQLTKTEGRVHGFLVNHVFYVVWFDPNHVLYA